MYAKYNDTDRLSHMRRTKRNKHQDIIVIIHVVTDEFSSDIIVVSIVDKKTIILL